MEKSKLNISFSDDRGYIIDLIENAAINSVTMITFKKDAVRANHYHKATTQWNFLVSGKIMLRTQNSGKEPVDTIMDKGDLTVTLPNECHALLALEDSELLVLTQGPRGGKEYESDTYRVVPPLIK